MKHRKGIKLLRKYLKGEASPGEAALVEKWYASSTEEKGASEADSEPGDPAPDQGQGLGLPADLSSLREAIYLPILSEMEKWARIRPLYKRPFFRLAAASVVLILAGATTWFLHSSGSRPLAAHSAIKKEKVPVQVPGDLPSPNSIHAVLTLASGQQILLDSARNGSLAVQGTTRVTKNNNGQISYLGETGSGGKTVGATSNERAVPVQYNTITVPRGSKILQLQLADGSYAALNAASSITYPTAFTGGDRTVSVTGEVYFEITKNAASPFYVKHNDITIKVLGTHFNVNTYTDEKNAKITLMEGSVDVSKGRSSRILRPGQQATVNNSGANNSGADNSGANNSGLNKAGSDNDGNIRVTSDVDMEQVIAWKNGRFHFEDKTDIGTIMRQLSRWYDVEIEYRGEVKQYFWGSISRDVNVSEVLQMLQRTGGVKFKLEGKKVIVMPE